MPPWVAADRRCSSTGSLNGWRHGENGLAGPAAATATQQQPCRLRRSTRLLLLLCLAVLACTMASTIFAMVLGQSPASQLARERHRLVFTWAPATAGSTAAAEPAQRQPDDPLQQAASKPAAAAENAQNAPAAEVARVQWHTILPGREQQQQKQQQQRHQQPPDAATQVGAAATPQSQQQQDQQKEQKQQPQQQKREEKQPQQHSSSDGAAAAPALEPPARDDTTSRYIVARGVAPTRLRFPLWWHGPIWSGSGYGSEAINFVLSLLRTGRLAPADIWAINHGDERREHVVRSMPPVDRAELELMQSLPVASRSQRPGAVVVCHSVCTNWAFPEPMWAAGAPCPPNPAEFAWVYQIGRTMFETDRLPSMFVPRLNAMNEVWVPSAWQRDNFISSGVDPAKLVVMPEGVNTTWLDPASHAPLDLPARAKLVFGKPWQEKQQQRRPFRFVTTFKWEQRKGWPLLLEAFLSEFTADDNVELFILTQPFGDSGSGFTEKMRGWADGRFGSAASLNSQLGKVKRQQQAEAEAATQAAVQAALRADAAAGELEVAGEPAALRHLLADSGRAAGHLSISAAAATAGSREQLDAAAGSKQELQQAHAADVISQVRRFVSQSPSLAAATAAAADGGGPSRTLLAARAAAAASRPAPGSVPAELAAAAAAEARRYPTLYVVDSHISDDEFPGFYKAGDAFVLPTRGEGWGRPHVEAMSMGLPVISTNWSGITAYLDESVGYPVAIDGLVPVSGGSEVAWWFKGLHWAQPSVRHLKQLMRRVTSNREEAAARGAAARARMVRHYSPEAIADLVVRELQRIEDLIP